MEAKQMSNLVQERIKKMIEMKRQARKDDQNLTKRLKSNNEIQSSEIVLCDDPPKPQSSLRHRRPTSSIKPTSTTNSLTTTSSNPSPTIDLESTVHSIFQHSVKLREFLKNNAIPQNKYQEYRNRLLENELFVLGVMSKLKKREQEEQEIVQREVISRLSRIIGKEKQDIACQLAENKLKNIIEERLSLLNKY